MSLRFYLGNAGSGKTYRMMTELVAEAAADPSRNFLVIAPEQASMQVQEVITGMGEGGAVMNIDVLSFNRLAGRVFEEIGFSAGILLEENGKSFVLQKIALEKEKELTAFGSQLRKTGGITEMKSVISELMEYDISPDKLQEVAASLGDERLRERLLDISGLYASCREYLKGRFFVTEEISSVLAEHAGESSLIRNSILVFDGFTGFTPVQLKLMEKLLVTAPEIRIALTYDAGNDPGHVPYPWRSLPREDIFAMSADTIMALKKMADEHGVEIGQPVFVFGNEHGRFSGNPDLAHLEANLFRERPSACGRKPEQIRIFAFDTPSREADACARRIRSLVREQGLRYRDIAILTGDLPSCSRSLKRAFSEEKIPCFIDEKKNILNNPFVELLRSAMAAVSDGYSAESIFRMLKTGMTGLTEDEICRLENYVMACGVRGKKKWRTEWTRLPKYLKDRKDASEKLSALNASRLGVTALLDPLSEALTGRIPVREKAAALYEFVLSLDCQKKLKAREEFFREEGRFDLSVEYSHLYSSVMGILDKLVDVLGETFLSADNFRSLLETALSEMKVGVPPLGCDQVVVGDMERTRLKNIRVLFFLGVNEGLVPKAPKEGGFLSEADRAKLAEYDISLRPAPRDQMYVENYYLYLALTRPSETLYLSYARAEENGQARQSAYLIRQILSLFPGLAVEPEDRSPENFCETPEGSLDMLAPSLRELDRKAPDDSWYELYGWYRRNGSYEARLSALLAGALFRLPGEALTREEARALYGSVLRNSASRLEQFASCPFRHFVCWGLGLKEREQFELSVLDRGNILHEALQLFGEILLKRGQRWSDLDEAGIEALSRESLERAAQDRQIYTDSASNRYELMKVGRELKVTAWAIKKQLEAGDFEVTALERRFDDDTLKSRTIILDDGTRMILTGKIDRIDSCREEDRVYIRIIDYKTGSMKFDPVRICYGLQLQLPLYLGEVLESERLAGRHAVPAGLLYHKIEDPVLDESDVRKLGDASAARLEELKENGMISYDEDVLVRMDHVFAEGGTRSAVLPLKITKTDRRRYGKGVNYTEEHFLILERFARRCAKRLGEDIMSGNARVLPYKYGDELGCRYCPCGDICGFDPHMPEAEVRRLNAMDEEEAFRRMGEDDEVDG